MNNFDFGFMRSLLMNSVNYEAQKMNELPGLIFQAAATDAYTALHNCNGVANISTHMSNNAEVHLASLPWWQRFLFKGSVLYAFNIAEDVYRSYHRRFILGGEGEGWIDDRSLFNNRI